MKKPTQNKFLYSKKATAIKAARKGVFQSKESQKKFGLICKNRSMEMKETKKDEEIKTDSKK